MIRLMLSIRALFVIAAAILTMGAPSAQPYPSKPIRIIVPYAAGGVADNSSRLFARALEQELKQTIIIDNRAGGGGRIGAEVVSHAPADGYTLLLTTNGTHTYLPAMEKVPPYDSIKDFTPLSLVASYGFLMVVNPALPVHSIQEFIAYGKSHPGKLNFASSGPGGGPHFAGEVFKTMAGIEMTHIPYKGTGPGLQAVAAGDADLIFAADANALIDAGRLRLLGTTSGVRDPRYPNAPAIAEAGLAGYDLGSWIGFYGPPGLPDAIAGTLTQAIAKAITNPELRSSYAQLGLVPRGTTAQELVRIMGEEITSLRAVVERIGGIKP
jgi:tripartite-type tricarboxylate transporter receptor subunit TctC